MRTDLLTCELPFMDRMRFKWRVNTDERINASAKLVLDCLIMHVNCKYEECYPGQPLICSETALTENTVRAAVRSLRDCGWIEWRRAENGGFIYRIIWQANPEIQPVRSIRQQPDTPAKVEGAPPQDLHPNLRREITNSPLSTPTASREGKRSGEPSHSAEAEAPKGRTPAAAPETKLDWSDRIWLDTGPSFKARFYPTVSLAAFKKRLGEALKREAWDIPKVDRALCQALRNEPGGDAWEYVAGVLRNDGGMAARPLDANDPAHRIDYSRPAPTRGVM